MMIWAEHCHKLEPLPLLSAQWHCRSLERGWQIFLGGVFDLRVWMLFAARRNEDGNVHRRDGVSKTVTKNMWGGFFKNPKTKERPNPPALPTGQAGGEAGEAPFQPMGRHSRGKNITADTAERSFPHLMLKGIPGFLSVFFPRFTPLTLKQAFQTARTKRVSGFQPDDLKNHSFRPKYQPACSEGKPEWLEENPFPTLNDAPLTLQHTDAVISLTASAIALTPPSILMPDEGVKTPSTADVRTAHFDVLLLAVPARLLATFGRHMDANVFSVEKIVYC